MSIEEKKEFFKKYLSDETYSELEIVRRFYCFGHTHIFSNEKEKYFLLKEKIANYFNIHPNEVLMIGSGKLGFSIAPGQDWKHFNIDSDIDIAIISEKAFNFYWSGLLDFNIDIQRRTFKEEKRYRKFLKYFFKGWIRPDLFSFDFSGKSEWFDFFKDLSAYFFEFGEHKISAGLYKDFKSFEMYHQSNIKRLRINY